MSTPAETSLTPIFIVGVPWSGTTRVQRLLAAGDDAFSLLETYAHCGIEATAPVIDAAVAATDLEIGARPQRPRPRNRRRTPGEWRERFGIRDARRFERIAGDTLVDTGYELDRRWWLRQPLRSRL